MSFLWTAFTLLFLGSYPAIEAYAYLNLPQLHQSIRLRGETSSTWRTFLSRSKDLRELPPSLQASLIRSIPKTFTAACGNLMKEWAGEDARASAVWRVRLLHYDSARLWLALQCASSESRLADYHDEWLGLLRPGAGVLELLPLGNNSPVEDEVHQIDFGQHVSLPGAEGFSFRVTIPQNPCCDGPESRSQERLMIFADSSAGVVESLSIVTLRDDLSHCDDPEVDTETTYRAEIKYERDSKDSVGAISVNFHEKVVDTNWDAGVAKPHTTSENSGTKHFLWNSTTLMFKQVN